MSTPDQNLLRIEGDYTPNPKLQQIQNNYAEAIAAVNQIAEALGLTRNKDLTTILQAIADLKNNSIKLVECAEFGVDVLRGKVNLINAIATELKLNGDFEDADVLRQVKAERQVKECAMLAARERGEALDAIADELNITEYEYDDLIDRIKTERWIKEQAVADAKNKGESLDAIAEMLGIKFTGNTDDIYEAIAELKNQHKSEARINPLGDLHKRLAIALNLGNVFDDDDVLEAIAVIKKHNLAYTNIIRQTELALKIKEGSFSYVDGCGFISTLVSFRENILKALNISPSYYVINDQGSVLEAIANLKHSLQLSQNEVKELQEKVAGQWNRIVTLEDESRSLRNHPLPQRNLIAQIEALKAELEAIAKHLLIKFSGDTNEIHAAITELIKYSLRDSDRDELQSERDYYRGILDKLCDRGNFDSIEALEQFVDAGNIPYLSSQSELRQQLAESQAASYRYVGRIVELENEVRSLREPVPTTAVFLSTSELIQIIRSLLK